MAKPAHIILITNPFEPFKDTRTYKLEFPRGWRKQPVTLRGWMDENKITFTRPTFCLFNGKPIFLRQYTRKIKPGDTINFVACAGDPITVLYIIVAALVVASVVLALSLKTNTPLTGNSPQADPVYSLKGQRNQVRLGMPIERAYGRVRMWPSYAAQPYNQYHDNQQYLYELFCLGHGTFASLVHFIEDTPVTDFQDVEVEVIEPGGSVTLFPTNVATSVEVDGIELLGTGEAGAGTMIEDSEGDAGVTPVIDPTEHAAESLAGPFVVNASGTQTTKIQVDIAFPRGVYTQADNGTLSNLTVSWLFQLREIDGAGAPLGAWFTPSGLFSSSWTGNNVTPQRFTLEADVTAGRYEIRGSRTSVKDTSARSGNTLIWESLRCFLPSTTDFGAVTLVARKARATNNLNSNSAQRYNVTGTAKLTYWDPTLLSGAGDWSAAPAATRSPVWAFVDAFRAQYGARLATAYLDIDALVALDLVLVDREEYFDWIFDQRTTCWDVAKTIMAAVRAVPMLNGSRVTAIRDDVKTFPTAVFNPENIVKGSFKWEIKLPGLDANDGLVVTYTDPTTWKEETVLCCMDDESGDNPEQYRAIGITDRDHAYHLGMYLRSAKRLLTENFSFSTGLEGHIPTYGDMVAVSHPVPKWQYGGMILSIVKTALGGALFRYVFNLSEPVTFIGASSLLVRKKDGLVAGPYVVVTNGTRTSVKVTSMAADADLDALYFDGLHEKPLYLFGPSATIGKNVRIVSLRPTRNETVGLVGVPYDAGLFAKDDAAAPAIGETHGHLPAEDQLPAVSMLRVVRAPTDDVDGGFFVVASWFPMPGAIFYTVELSYGGNATDPWELVADTVEHFAQFKVTARYIYVRVRAINKAAGEAAYWTGQAPITNPRTVTAPTSLVVTSGSAVVGIQTDGTIVPRMKLAFTATTDLLTLAAGKIHAQFKITTETDWTDVPLAPGDSTVIYINNPIVGAAYNTRIRAENQYGAFSGWQTPAAGAHTVVGDTANPANPTGLTCTAGTGKALSLDWDDNTEPGLGEYGVYRNTVNNSATSTKLAEVRASRFVDVEVTLGTAYFYWVKAIKRNELVSGFSSGASGTPGVITSGSVDSTPPSNPSAPTLSSNTAYLAADGTAFAKLVINIPSMPTGAAFMTLRYRGNGNSGWIVADQPFSGGGTSTIDDLVCGNAYEVAIQAYSNFGIGSSIIGATSSPFTAASPAAPAAPTGLAVSTTAADMAGAPPRFIPTTGAKMGALKLTWTHSTAKDKRYYEIRVDTLTGTIGPYDDILVKVEASKNEVYLYAGPGFGTATIDIRTISYSAFAGSYSSGTTGAHTITYGTANMAEQTASAVAITGGTISGITDMAVADGGTGSSTASGARSNLGLGSMATQAASAVSISGGSAVGMTALGTANIFLQDASSGLSGATSALDVKGINQRWFDSGGTQRARVDNTNGNFVTNGGLIFTARSGTDIWEFKVNGANIEVYVNGSLFKTL